MFLESNLPGDSLFGPKDGEPVGIHSRHSAMPAAPDVPSQLDGDVDPVAEADVYLAYGRDQQAEEILQEALRVDPDRLAIRMKLLEIHAKRRDPQAYETLASELRELTHGSGPDWQRVAEGGREVDAGNPLYDDEAQPRAKPTVAPIDFDLGLDDDEPAPHPTAVHKTELDRLGAAFDADGESPHAIKLSLARELHALGDADGARTLAEEVATESSGKLQADATRLLSELR